MSSAPGFPGRRLLPPPVGFFGEGGHFFLPPAERIPRDSRTFEGMIGGSKVRSTPQKISYPEVLNFLTFDPKIGNFGQPDKGLPRGRKGEFLPGKHRSCTIWGSAIRPHSVLLLKQFRLPKNFNDFSYLRFFKFVNFFKLFAWLVSPGPMYG